MAKFEPLRGTLCRREGVDIEPLLHIEGGDCIVLERIGIRGRDEAAARQSILGALVASCWQVALIIMQMRSGFIPVETSEGSPGHDGLKWLKLARPGDRLSGMMEVTGMRLSRSRPNIVLVTAIATLGNQRRQQVYWWKYVSIVKARAAGGPQ